MLRLEYPELCDVLEVTDDRCLGALLLLAMLPCVPVLLCPIAGTSSTVLDVFAVLGLRSDLPSKGPGAMVFMRLVTLSPPSKRGLSGANNGLG